MANLPLGGTPTPATFLQLCNMKQADMTNSVIQNYFKSNSQPLPLALYVTTVDLRETKTNNGQAKSSI
jgi:hypothetical protein